MIKEKKIFNIPNLGELEITTNTHISHSCPICGTDAERLPTNGQDIFKFNCPQCGKFNISETLLYSQQLKILDKTKQKRISSYLFQYYTDFKKEFLLHTNNYSKIITIPDNIYETAMFRYREQGIPLDRTLYDFAREYKHLKLTKEIELNFHRLIKDIEERLPAEQQRTNAINVSLIQKIAKKINSKGPFIDLAVGFGGLIWQLDNISYIQDINKNILDIAELIAFQSNNTCNVLSNDSIKDPLPNNGKGIFLFDPPMGQNRARPKEWNAFAQIENASKLISSDTINFKIESTVSNILGSKEKEQSPTEILFITNFLLQASDDAHFICLVPETFLTKNEQEYNNLRAYLIKNSLIAVIKPPASSGINTVVLFGQKKKEENKPVKLIVTKKYNNQEVIDYIFEDKEITDEKIKLDSLNPFEITEPYLIKMPVIAESKGYEYIPSEKVIDAIIENEKILDEKKKPIISKEILKYKIFAEENKKESDEVIKVWWEEKSDISDTREKIVDAGYSELKEIFNYFAANGYFDKEEKEQEFNIALLNNFSELVFFLLLLTKGYIRKQEDKYIINTKRPEQQSFILNDEEIRKTYDTYLHPKKQKGDALILLAYTDEFVKKVYLDICLYYILDKKQNNIQISFEKRADVLRALKILEKLGLVRTQMAADKFIYNHYMPRYYFEGKWIYG